MDRILKNKKLCLGVLFVLILIIVTKLSSNSELALIKQYGGNPKASLLNNPSFREANALGRPQSITGDVSLFLDPNGGQNIDQILGATEIVHSLPADYGLNTLTKGDQKSLAVARARQSCLDARGLSAYKTTSQNYPRYIKPEFDSDERARSCATCQPRQDWNYVAKAGGTTNQVWAPNDPSNPNQSEFYSQFFRDTQNNLSEHSVENFRYPTSSTLTSSYRNSPQYCGIGQTVNDIVENDHCLNPFDEPKPKSRPDIINTQINPYNRRLRNQIKYKPIQIYDEIIPSNGFLNEKPANFTSEHTRTFDWFTSASLGSTDLLY